MNFLAATNREVITYLEVKSIWDVQNSIVCFAAKLRLIFILYLLFSNEPHALKSTEFITVRNKVVKVMFYTCLSFCSQGGVSASVHAGIAILPHQAPRGTPAPGKNPREAHPTGDGCRCGRYASYWNAFLLKDVFNKKD